MIDICYLFPDFFFIGAQRAAAASIRKLKSKGWNIAVIVINKSGGIRNELPSGVQCIDLPSIPVLSSIPLIRIFAWPFALRNLFKKEKPRYCVSICPQTNFVMVLYRIFFGRDVVFIGEEHQHLSNAIKNDPSDFKRPWKFLYYCSLRNYYRLDALRCVSKAAAEDFILQWKVPVSKVKTIYPAFDLERIKARSHDVRRDNRVPVICSIGRLTTQKDFALLIRAFYFVRRQCDAVLKIGGTGPEKAALESLANELGLKEDISFLGFVEYAEEVIASSDLFVMTSIWEGFPATLVESMVLGTPVVSVNCESGPAELIEDGISGVLVDNRDPEAIGDAIIRMIKEPQVRRAMSLKAQESVKRFSLDRTVTDLEDLLLSIQ